jgi:hypothetical protein
MKNIIIVILAAFISFPAFSQTRQYTGIFSGGHDSLIFDGSNGTANNLNINDECNLKVINVIGTSYGTILTTKIENVCGETDTFKTLTYGQLKTGDILASEDFIRTKAFSQVEVMLHSGKTVWLGPDTEFKMGRDYCKGNGIAELLSGQVHVSGGDGESNTYINAGHSTIHITHTEFSLETVIVNGVQSDLLRVYEGTVTIGLNLQNQKNMKKTEDKGAEIQKLSDDFQNGKISMEEYATKMQELQKNITESLPLSAITVTAGYESNSIGEGSNPTEPALFDMNENRWWEK